MEYSQTEVIRLAEVVEKEMAIDRLPKEERARRFLNAYQVIDTAAENEVRLPREEIERRGLSQGYDPVRVKFFHIEID